ncbi:MAG: hypothetical protein WCG34_09275 [Leptolinea sp.]
METNTLVNMTQSAFKEMLEDIVEAAVEQKMIELFGDSEDGLVMRQSIRDRLAKQRMEVASGQTGQDLEDVVRKLGLS